MDEITKRLEKEKVSTDCILGILMLGGLQRRPRISVCLGRTSKDARGPKSSSECASEGRKDQLLQMLVILQIK